jgi:hypothetical protein
MSNEIYAITNDEGIVSLYDNLERAKYELKKIYNATADFRYNNYNITVYCLVEDEYVKGNTTYTYTFDAFSKISIVR